MKYIITKTIHPIYGEFYSITTTSSNDSFTSFSVKIGNHNYEAFLKKAQITDKQVYDLKTDTWYDFPKDK
jgi:hypothetical protein